MFINLHSSALIVFWQFMCSSCICLQSDIPNNVSPFYGTTKKLHWYFMPSLIMLTLPIPIHYMHEVWGAARLFICLLTCLTHSHQYVEENFVHQLVITTCVYCFTVLCCFLLLILQLLLIWLCGYRKMYILPYQTPVSTSVCSSSWCVSWIALHLSLQPSFDTCLLWLLHTHSNWFTPTSWIALAIGWAPSCVMCTATVLQLLHVSLLWYSSFVQAFYSIEFLLSYVVSFNAFCALCILILLAQDNTWSLLISFNVLVAVSSLIICHNIFIIYAICELFSLISCLFLYKHIHLPILWGGPSSLQHFHFVFVQICNMTMKIRFHYTVVWIYHLVLQTVLCLFCTFPASCRLELYKSESLPA